MSQQRVHKSTLENAKKLKKMYNEDMDKLGLKRVSTPDVYEAAILSLLATYEQNEDQNNERQRHNN